ncbi:MAG: FAD-dependent oxidoreductase [Bacteroidota bacterium]|nr:FAD-dependent oxidoreductase [Bacteroidota bacterium]
MKNRRILIVGGLAAGPSAAAKAKRSNPNAEIILFEAGETVSYGICEAPYAISGLIEDEEKLVKYSPEKLQQEKGVAVKTLHRVENILPTKHTILVRDLRNHSIIEYDYDKLVLAMGSVPRRLKVSGEDGRNVFHLKSREDTLNIINYMKTESPKQAVIIGGGYIGMEMAEAFRLRGLDTTMLHQFNLPMEGLELETRERVLEELKKNDVQFVTNTKIEAFQQDTAGKVKHIITNRGSFEADIVILSLGVEPNVELAKAAKVRLGSNNGILTDERQQTNIEDVYAAGDCCEVKNIVTGKPMYLPLASIASRSGWVAGENAAGGRATFKGAIRAMAVKIFNLQVTQVGISSDEAKQSGFKVITDLIHAPSRNELMPGSEDLTIKFIIDQRTKRLLGANLFSCCGAVLRANTLAVAIQHKMTIDDISRFDLIYAPPYAPLWDPILVVANQAKKKII